MIAVITVRGFSEMVGIPALCGRFLERIHLKGFHIGRDRDQTDEATHRSLE